MKLHEIVLNQTLRVWRLSTKFGETTRIRTGCAEQLIENFVDRNFKHLALCRKYGES